MASNVTPRPPASDDRLEAIDFERYVPTLVARLAGELRSSANRFFGERFDLSLLEWRVLAYLAAEGTSSAYRLWTTQRLEKALVSRVLRGLRERGLIEIRTAPDARRRATELSLTQAGSERYRATFDEVERRHARLVAGLGREQLEGFVATLAHLRERLPLMGREDEPGDPGLMPIRKTPG